LRVFNKRLDSRAAHLITRIRPSLDSRLCKPEEHDHCLAAEIRERARFPRVVGQRGIVSERRAGGVGRAEFLAPGRSGGDERADGNRRGQARDGAHHCQ
jgi:hypothetical protein